MSYPDHVKFVSVANIKDSPVQANPSPIRVVRLTDHEALIGAAAHEAKTQIRKACVNVAYAVHSMFESSDMTIEQSDALKKRLNEIVDKELNEAQPEHKENKA